MQLLEKEITFALIGFGRFGKHHANVLKHHPNSLIKAICETNPIAAEQARIEVPDAKIYTDPLNMLQEVDVDVVTVVSPEDTHAEIVEAALNNGFHVFCEKPLATQLSDARQLAQLAQEKNLKLRVGYLLRYEPRHRVLKQQIEAKKLGQLASIRAKRDISRSWFEAYGYRVHSAFETLIHDVDLVLWFSQQRCQSVSAWGGYLLGYEVPETLVMVLEMEKGTICTLESSWLAPSGAPANIFGWEESSDAGKGVIDASLEVIGTEGSSFLKTYEPSLTINDSTGSYCPDLAFWPQIDGRTVGALREEIWDFIQELLGDSYAQVDSLEDAVHVQEICEAAVESEKSGKKIKII
jgi:predicted dehydrogenase